MIGLEGKTIDVWGSKPTLEREVYIFQITTAPACGAHAEYRPSNGLYSAHGAH